MLAATLWISSDNTVLSNAIKAKATEIKNQQDDSSNIPKLLEKNIEQHVQYIVTPDKKYLFTFSEPPFELLTEGSYLIHLNGCNFEEVNDPIEACKIFLDGLILERFGGVIEVYFDNITDNKNQKQIIVILQPPTGIGFFNAHCFDYENGKLSLIARTQDNFDPEDKKSLSLELHKIYKKTQNQ